MSLGLDSLQMSHYKDLLKEYLVIISTIKCSLSCHTQFAGKFEEQTSCGKMLVYFGSKFCPHISVHNFNLLPSNIAFLPPAFNMQMPAGLSRDPYWIGWKDSIPFLIVGTSMSKFLGLFFYFDKLWLIIIVNLFSWLQGLSGKLMHDEKARVWRCFLLRSYFTISSYWGKPEWAPH